MAPSLQKDGRMRVPAGPNSHGETACTTALPARLTRSCSVAQATVPLLAIATGDVVPGMTACRTSRRGNHRNGDQGRIIREPGSPQRGFRAVPTLPLQAARMDQEPVLARRRRIFGKVEQGTTTAAKSGFAHDQKIHGLW